MNIGFIGLGAMGGAMAGRLADAGHRVAVHDTNPAALKEAAARGAVPCENARAVGDAAQIVFACLPSPEVSFAVAAELAESASCDMLVEMSTVGRPAMDRLAQILGGRIALLDCPISGGRPGALAGKLSAIVSGAPADIERARPLLDVLAAKVFVVGERPGMAQVCKIVNNAISLTGLIVACEAVTMGVKAGLDAATMIDVINASTGRNSGTVDKFPRAILPRTFDYGGPITIGAKDLALYLSEAKAQGVPALAVSNPAQMWAMAVERFEDVGFSPKMEALLGPRRPVGKRWESGSDEDRRYADIAATTQAVTEDVLVALAREAKRRTGVDALCLAGGVALNAVANARLLRESGFARIFAQPAAGDAGGAVGAALLGAIGRGAKRPSPMTTAALGEEIDPAAARELAGALGLSTTTASDPAAVVADRLAAGKIVAIAQGRFEWGPRALGQRSILALPRDPAIRERLNVVVKKREPFRPFAPAVPSAYAAAFFDGAPNDLTPFMTTTCAVRGDDLAAVTHVDGSARVQTVTAGSAPFLDRVLAAVLDRTGTPIVLNTSLNGPGEPIVASATDALGFFCAHPVDTMVIGDLVVERP